MRDYYIKMYVEQNVSWQNGFRPKDEVPFSKGQCHHWKEKFWIPYLVIKPNAGCTSKYEE
jgi:hypothetical protein